MTYPENSLNRVHALSEQVHAELFKAGPSDGGVEVGALKERVDFDAGLCGTGKGSLCPLRGCQESAHCPRIVADVLLVLSLEFLQTSIRSDSTLSSPLEQPIQQYMETDCPSKWK